MNKPDFLLLIDEERCKGCELCIEFCPKGVLALASSFNRFGHHPAMVVRQEDCSGCQACVTMCPDACIELYRRKSCVGKTAAAPE
ncbi:MAG: 4Fe-4S binding protein [Armatimonadetes bacterium]|nr:4Fe-4S binding protein [Armatimonadota bacterium]